MKSLSTLKTIQLNFDELGLYLPEHLEEVAKGRLMSQNLDRFKMQMKKEI